VITLEQRLLAAAGRTATATMNPDEWAYYRNNFKDAYGNKVADLPASALDVWFPNGRPENVADYPQITAAQFQAGLATKGLSGYWRVIPVPGNARVWPASMIQ
jgi:hypothetical protein